MPRFLPDPSSKPTIEPSREPGPRLASREAVGHGSHARMRLAIAAVVDIALHARPQPVNARLLAERHGLPPRHLETVLQALVRHGLLKGMRGPRGGYELARERRRISLGDIARATSADAAGEPVPASFGLAALVEPTLREAQAAFLATLDTVSVEDLCRQADAARATRTQPGPPQFDI